MADPPKWALSRADILIAAGPGIAKDQIGNSYSAYVVNTRGHRGVIDFELANLSSDLRQFVALELAAIFGEHGLMEIRPAKSS